MHIRDIVHRIEEIAKIKETELEEAQYEKYHDIFDTAIRALKRMRVMMYGGLAINDLLPEKLKFYPPRKLPDIDVFAVNAVDVAKQVVQYFKKHGYPLASFGPALHHGTFKVYVDGLQVVDVTNIAEKAYRHLVRDSVKGPHGLNIINPEYLRMTLHYMLSSPNDVHRWSKVYQRLVAFYEAFPVKKPKSGPIIKSKIPQDIYDAVTKFITSNEYVLFGDDGTRYILADGDVLSVATKLAQEVPSLEVGELYASDDIAPTHVVVTYKRKKVLWIYQTNSCMSYVTVDGHRVASVDTLITMYLQLALSTFKHHNRDALRRIADMTTLSLLASMKTHSKRKQLQQFVLTCYGTQPGVATLIRKKHEKA